MSDKLVVLRQWAQFGKTYAPGRVSRPDWSAVNRLIDSAKPYLREDATELRHLLERWSARFGMQDPLLNDLGTHHWLDKETSYSDWFAWVLERLEPTAVLDILDVKPRPEHAGRCRVQRESQLDEKYIDLLIRFDGVPDYAIGVEVKTYDEQYAKQKDYFESIRSFYGKDMPCVLISIRTDIKKDRLCCFHLRPWREVTFALRAKVAEYASRNGPENRIVTAMMLGFVAAAEQNLLEYSAAAPRRASKYEPALIPRDLVKYLKGDK